MKSPLKYYRLLTGAFIALTVIVTWKLWSADRLFPTAPLFGIHSFITANAGVAFKVALIIAALLFAVGIRFSEWVLLALLTIGMADDLNRLRPDFYQYFMIALMFGLATVFSANNLHKAFRLINGGIYFWTGAQKLNMGFVHFGREFLQQGVGLHQLPEWCTWVVVLIPLVEIVIGFIFLTGSKFNVAIIAAFILHIIIIAQLVLSDWNTTMIPYNVFLTVGNIILFATPIPEEAEQGSAWLPKMATIFFAILPALNFVHLWPTYTSAGLYSCRAYYASVNVDSKLEQQLDPLARSVIFHTSYGNYLQFHRWMQAETGCVPNPEKFVYNKMFEQMKTDYALTDSIRLYVYQ